MSALLNDGSFVEHGDLITEFAGRQAMADIDGRLVARNIIELAVNFSLTGICASATTSICLAIWLPVYYISTSNHTLYFILFQMSINF